MRVVHSRKRVWEKDYAFEDNFILLTWILALLKWKEYGFKTVLYTDYATLINIQKYHFGIEVTENSKYHEKTNLMNLFKILHNYGINVYMDDFSMGFTSIKFLQDTAFDYVKLDGSLVRNLENERTHNIIKSIIDLGQSLNFEVVAECVETKEQVDKLIELGCNTFQGFLFYKPCSFENIIKVLKK